VIGPVTLTIHTTGPEATQQVGRIIGDQAQPGDIYLLTGPLGAGKTCLTQGIAWGLGVAGHPRSPTFVLITHYQGRLTLHHMDLYRINDSLEAWDLGLEEFLSGDGVCVIEWADQAEELFPEDALWIDLDYATRPPPPGVPAAPGKPAIEERAVGADDAAGTGTGPVASGEAVNSRTITLGRHSPRYDSLLARLSGVFPNGVFLNIETND
jgi:tRNA threonylcarbamoyladenosine biosynthesis protein TsaE